MATLKGREPRGVDMQMVELLKTSVTCTHTGPYKPAEENKQHRRQETQTTHIFPLVLQIGRASCRERV